MGRGDLGLQVARRAVKRIRHRCRAVPYRNPEPFFRDVQSQCRAHRAKADQADFYAAHGHCTPLRFRITEYTLVVAVMNN